MPKQPLGQRLGGHMMGDYAPHSNRSLLTAAALTALHFLVYCLVSPGPLHMLSFCLRRFPSHVQMTHPLRPSGLYSVLSLQGLGGQLSGSSCVIQFPSQYLLFVGINYLFILSLSLPLGWKFEQAGGHVHRSSLTVSTG